jgi:hypothetical protein
MFDLPFGKAIIAVKNKTAEPECPKCCFFSNCSTSIKGSAGDFVACQNIERKDGKNVHYELVDYPAKEEL